jgi:hypothetical protein
MDSARGASPRKITDLAEFAADYIAELRGMPPDGPRGRFLEYAYHYFSDNRPSMALLEALGLMFVDRLYRLSAELPFKDAYVLAYASTVTGYVLDVVRTRGVQMFYVLDNRIPEDRFQFARELMREANIHVVTPYGASGILGTVGTVDEVCAGLDLHLLAGRHVAYIEKDATVDYLEPVIAFAATTDAYVIFRNEVPSRTVS